jgi:FG-GAP-like repeat
MKSRAAFSRFVLLVLVVAPMVAGLIWVRSGFQSAAPPLSEPVWTDATARRRSDPLNAIDSRALKLSKSRSVDAPGERDEATLKEDQRKYLWEVEHHGLLLGRFGFARLAQALRRGETADFLAVLDKSFEGQTLAQPRETRSNSPEIRVVRQQDSLSKPLALDRSQFVARLFEDRKKFSRPPQVKLALMGLAPTNSHDLEGEWEGTCQLRMWGEVASGRPSEIVLYLKYRLPKPTEDTLKGDGWLRFCSVTGRQSSEADHFLMREVTDERGIQTERFHDNWKKGINLVGVTGGEYLCDFNRDGCLDLLLVDVNGNFLYEGQPSGKFVDVTARMKLPQSAGLQGAAIVDLDNDGWEDFILGSFILRNLAGREFRSVPPIPGLSLRADASAIVADYDRDGLLDLYVTALGQMKVASWIGGEGKSVSGNVLWHNDGNWHFTDVTRPSGASGGGRSTFSALWLDADLNGWPDLYVINEFGNGILLVNRSDGTFREQEIVSGPGDFGSMGLACGDYDNDGHIDIYVANMYSKAGNRVIGNLWPGTYPEPILAKLRALTSGSQLHHNLGGLKFERVGSSLHVADVGWAYGPAMVDLNNDGWLDIFATCGYMSRSRDDPDG